MLNKSRQLLYVVKVYFFKMLFILKWYLIIRVACARISLDTRVEVYRAGSGNDE